MDRTNWKLGEKNINILMLGVSYRNIAFPLMFKMLDKRGNSHTLERIGLIKAWHLFNDLRVGQLKHYDKIMKLGNEYCYLSDMKTTRNGKLEFCIVVFFNKPDQALEKYRQRWQIETLSRGLKSSEFNLEDTHVTHLDSWKS